MISIGYFIAGFIFATIGYTLIDAICTTISYLVELIKGKIGVKVAKYNAQIDKLTEDKTQSVQAIGFTIPDEEDEDNE